MKLGRLDVSVVGSRVTLVGRIDDTSPLGELVAQLPADVTIDTEGVTFINSIGMREWIRLLRGLSTKSGTVTLERVADVLITQMNLLPAVAKNVRVVSFHAQYACAKCGAEVAPLVDAVANAELLQRLKAPALPCPECGSAMELADYPERYLTLFKA
jgi:DNA-directed RNA polymerase subunit RPC12/RpoP